MSGLHFLSIYANQDGKLWQHTLSEGFEYQVAKITESHLEHLPTTITTVIVPIKSTSLPGHI